MSQNYSNQAKQNADSRSGAFERDRQTQDRDRDAGGFSSTESGTAIDQAGTSDRGYGRGSSAVDDAGDKAFPASQQELNLGLQQRAAPDSTRQ